MTDHQKRLRIRRIKDVAHYIRSVPAAETVGSLGNRMEENMPEPPVTAVPFSDLEEAFFRKPLGA